MTQPVTITDATFQQEVVEADVPVIVDLWAAWCAPCKMIAPILQEVAEEYAGVLKVAKLNVDQYPDRALEYNVQAIPTLLFFKDRTLVERLVGFMTKGRILERIEPYIRDPVP